MTLLFQPGPGHAQCFQSELASYKVSRQGSVEQERERREPDERSMGGREREERRSPALCLSQSVQGSILYLPLFREVMLKG
mmetsp:Transcript_705/g.1599  ORF Transcript_705/g.1599 Transcript_705/m.1599 type:complete len:81 (-) Transcript_705:93-335(-)